VGDIFWHLDWTEETGFFMKERWSDDRFSFNAKKQTWFPTLQECLTEGFGTVADISVAEKSSDYTIIKLSDGLKKLWKFSEYDEDISAKDRNRPKVDGPVIERQGIRITHGVRRNALNKKIDPNKMFTEVIGGANFIKIKCKENRTESPNYKNPKDTVFKFDLFLETKKRSGLKRVIWIDPIIRNDGGGGPD